jgi:hypothetical protein
MYLEEFLMLSSLELNRNPHYTSYARGRDSSTGIKSHCQLLSYPYINVEAWYISILTMDYAA